MFMALQFACTREHISKSMFVSELVEFSETSPPDLESLAAQLARSCRR